MNLGTSEPSGTTRKALITGGHLCIGMATSEQDYVIPAAAGLDEAPPIDEREFVEVDLEHIDDSVIQGPDYKECQHCGEAVAVRELHAYVCIWADDAISRIMYKVVFCGQECWLAWMRR